MKHARIVTSEQVKQEIIENKLKKKELLNNSPNVSKAKSVVKEMVNMASDESNEIIDCEKDLPTTKELSKGNYVIIEYQGKHQYKYYVSVIADVDEGEKLYKVTFCRYGRRLYFEWEGCR